MHNICIFASGSGTNAEAIIQFFADNPQVKVCLIVSSRKDAYVLKRAENHQIPSLVLDRNAFRETDKLLGNLKDRDVDFIILAGFMWLVPTYLVAAYPNRIVNIHPALLPKYGGKGMYGSHVHEAVISAGEKESGITIHFVNENYDEGAIIAQATCEVTPEDTPESLAEKIHKLEHQHFPRVIEEVISRWDFNLLISQ